MSFAIRGYCLPAPNPAIATFGRARHGLPLPGRGAAADLSEHKSGRFHVEKPPPLGHARTTRKSKYLSVSKVWRFGARCKLVEVPILDLLGGSPPRQQV